MTVAARTVAPLNRSIQRAYLSNPSGWFGGTAGRVPRCAVSCFVGFGDEDPDGCRGWTAKGTGTFQGCRHGQSVSHQSRSEDRAAHETVAASAPALSQQGSTGIGNPGPTNHQWGGVRGQTGPREWPLVSRWVLVFRSPASDSQIGLHPSWWNPQDRGIL